MNAGTAPGDIPFLTTEQMREVDRAMVDEYHIELIQMRENAGRRRFLNGIPTGKRIVVLAGRGGNGGGARVCARRLHGWGAEVLRAFAATEPTIQAPQRRVELEVTPEAYYRDPAAHARRLYAEFRR